jgi:hypothetical protein
MLTRGSFRPARPVVSSPQRERSSCPIPRPGRPVLGGSDSTSTATIAIRFSKKMREPDYAC